MSDFNYPTVWLKAMENHPLHSNRQKEKPMNNIYLVVFGNHYTGDKMEQQTIKQMEQNVAELLAKAEEMKQLLEKAKKEETWPVKGDSYWYASGNGNVYHGIWENFVDAINRQKFGNVHRSREDAELYVQKRLVQVELENLAKKAWKEIDEQINWNTDQAKYHLYYDYEDDCFFVSANTICQHIGQVFFPTEKSTLDAITAIGEERLKVLLK